MNSDEYREQLRRQIQQEMGERAPDTLSAADSEVASLISSAPADSKSAKELLRILGDPARSAETRRAGLQALQQLSFNVPLFTKVRPGYIETLRNVIDDPDEQLREIAIEGLAQEKDEYVQRRLLAGLTEAEEPLVDDEKAIQFLGYDIHAEHFPILRRLAQESLDVGTRREAVKLLSADTQSADLLLKIYDNKGEDDEVRSASASALLSLDPLKFEQRAKLAVVDESDTESVRAASLTALTYFANPSAIASDTDFVKQVAKVETRVPELLSVGEEVQAAEKMDATEEGQLAKAVRLFQSRYGR